MPETLFPALNEVQAAFDSIKSDSVFQAELHELLCNFVGRPTPLYFAKNMSLELGHDIYLKREDLNHTGAHKINNAVGQALMAKKMGKTRIIAETGAGQHGVATATACALLNLECVVYMGEEDMRRQALNVYRMKLLGATVVGVSNGSRTLKDAVTEAIRDWMSNLGNTFYLIGSIVGPAPHPEIVEYFQSIIGREAKEQLKNRINVLPDIAVACVGGGSNAIGLFHDFIDDKSVELIAVEAAGKGLDTNEHSASLTKGTPGILHGSYSYLLQSETGQVGIAHSISAGLDYPGVGPALSILKDAGRLTSTAVTDDAALKACYWASKTEGLIPALETAHAFAWLKETAPTLPGKKVILLNVSGRGDKDMQTLMENSDILFGDA